MSALVRQPGGGTALVVDGLTCTASDTPTWFDVRDNDGRMVALVHHPADRVWWLHPVLEGERSRHRSLRGALEEHAAARHAVAESLASVPPEWLNLEPGEIVALEFGPVLEDEGDAGPGRWGPG